MSVAQQAYTAGMVAGVTDTLLAVGLVVAVLFAAFTERHRLWWAALVAFSGFTLGRAAAAWWPL